MPREFAANDETPPAWMDEVPPDMADDKPRPPLALIDPSEWGDEHPPARRWAVAGMVPYGQATLLTGAGSAGKSLVEQLQCTCIALGLPWLGIETEQAIAVYISCEDDADELWRRQRAICDSLGVTLADTSGKLYLLSLAGEVDNEFATFDERGRIHVAGRFRDIQDALGRVAARFVALDNTGHFFSGNENDRHQVASFVGLCNGLASTIDGSVVLIGHPNKAGGEYSGSTAWENQVRSRLFMEIPTADNGSIPDPDARVIRRGKSNYAQKGEELYFVWHKWSFIRIDDLPDEERADLRDTAQAAYENDLFLNCLTKATAAKRAVSHVNGINYAPRIFAGMPEAKRTKEMSFAVAMERLISVGRIELEANLWKGPNRHWKVGIKEVGPCANPPAEMAENRAPTHAPTPCANPRQPPGQVIDNAAPTLRCADPLPLKGESGGPFDGPPAWMDEVPWE